MSLKSSGRNFCSQATVASFGSMARFTIASSSWSDTSGNDFRSPTNSLRRAGNR